MLGRLGGVMGCLEAVFGPLGGVLARPWYDLGQSLGRLRVYWSILGASWGRLGGVLGHLGNVLGAIPRKTLIFDRFLLPTSPPIFN